VVSGHGDVIYTTETDSKTGRGRIGVRDARSLKNWPSGTATAGAASVAARRRRAPDDRQRRHPAHAQRQKYDLHRMDSSLVRLDGQSGRLLRQWTLEDRRLSLRHLAWSQGTTATDNSSALPCRPNMTIQSRVWLRRFLPCSKGTN
jgi:hypothetical protein